MIRCREVSKLIADGSFEDAGFLTRLSVRTHLMMCSHCRRFLAQIRMIQRTYRTLLKQYASHEEKLARQRELVRNLTNQSPSVGNE